MIAWFKKLFSQPEPRELIYVPYADADQILKTQLGWRIAPEEDRNRDIGFVFLERPSRSANEP